MLFSVRDIDVLKIVCWVQYIRPERLLSVITETELQNLMSLGFIKGHEKSGALVLTSKGFSFLQTVFHSSIPVLAQSYHSAAIQRRLRQSLLALTAYCGGVDIFVTSPEELFNTPSLFFPTITRGHSTNPWGNVRVAAISNLGNLLYAIHYVCPGIGKLVLMDELNSFINQTVRFRDARRAFIFAGESYGDILAELEASEPRTDTKLISYGAAYRCLQLPVHLLSCDDAGAVQLQIMSVPDYRRKLTRAALKGLYQPSENPAWDALFQGMPFIMAADMDLRRLDAAISIARQEGFQQIAVAALEGQAKAVLFPRYRDTGKARVFILTGEAVSEVTGRPPVPYTPPRTQFLTAEGDVIDAPSLQASGRAGRQTGSKMRSLV